MDNSRKGVVDLHNESSTKRILYDLNLLLFFLKKISPIGMVDDATVGIGVRGFEQIFLTGLTGDGVCNLCFKARPMERRKQVKRNVTMMF